MRKKIHHRDASSGSTSCNDHTKKKTRKEIIYLLYMMNSIVVFSWGIKNVDE